MAVNIKFDFLHGSCQKAILENVGRWLGYQDIKVLVGLFNTHNLHSVNAKKIKVPEMLTEAGFIKAVCANIEPQIRDCYLNCRLIEIIRTPDSHVSKLLVTFPFNSLRELPIHVVSKVLKKAAEHGHEDVVFDLISNDPISEEDCQDAMRLAMKNSHQVICSDLLNHVILEQTREELITNKETPDDWEMQGNRGIITILTPEEAGDYLMEKEKAKHPLTFIRLETKAMFLSQPSVGYYSTILDLLRREIPSEQERIMIVKWIATNGHYRLMRMGLELGLFSSQEKEWAFYLASRLGDIKMVQLVDDGKISDEGYGNALCCAADCSHMEVVTQLLKKSSISIYFREKALLCAVANGNIEIFLAIDDGTITKNNEVLHFAIEKRNFAFIKELLLRKEITKQEREDAIEYAVQMGALEIASLFNDGAISKTK